MEFLNKPMSDFWKSTRQTFAEIMDLNDTVIDGKQRSRAAVNEESGAADNKCQNGSSDEPTQQSVMTSYDMGNVSQETLKPRREKLYQKHSSSKSKRPVSEDLRQKEVNSASESLISNVSPTPTTATTTSQQKEQSSRHSLNTHFGKIWKDFKTLNMMTPSNSGSKSDASLTTKKSHLKMKSGPTHTHSKESITFDSTSKAGQAENEKTLRSHRTHSHSRSRQGSMSDSQHFRSNSTDRASVMKYKEASDKGQVRPFVRSASDDAMLSADQVVQHDTDEDVEDISAEKMKTKILSMWNNVRYGWTVKTRTAFSLVKPIWILGKSFQNRLEDVDERLPGLDAVKSPAVELFKREFSSRIWLTYRREFPQLAGSSYTSDCGWGCMLRSGQMMLAQALVQHFLGRDWNYYNEQTPEEQRYHHEIVRWFGDQPDDMSPFSLHQLVEIGKSTGKKAGDWYGPASVAHIFKEAMDQAMDLNPLLEQVCVYVAQDCTIYKEDVINLCKRKQPGSLQPVYSDHGLTSSPLSSPVSHPPNSTHQFPAESSLPAADTPSTSATISDSALDAHTLNGTSHEGYKSIQQTTPQQSSHSDIPRNDQRNGGLNTAVDALPPYPTISTAVADTSAESNIAHLKALSVSSHSPIASTTPKTVHCPLWTNNSLNPEKHSTDSQREDRSWTEMQDVNKMFEGKAVGEASMTESNKSKKKEDAASWCAVVIFVPVRLGGDEVNPIYVNSVQALFTLECCIGIIGGKPKHSLYYVGFQEEKLIHLDPHYCQPVVDMRAREFPLSSFHCMSPRKMAISKMDPSCTIGFYLRKEEDFRKFCEIVPSIVQGPGGGTSSTDYPMFILREGSCHDWNSQPSVNSDKPERYLRVRHINKNGQLIAPMRETDDFVFLDS